MLIIPINGSGQNINSYNIDAKLNSEDKTIEIYQIMKFKNTSNTPLNEIFLEDWSNSYLDNTTSLAKRISDEYSRSFSFAQKKQRGSSSVNNIKSNNIETWERLDDALDIIKVDLKKPISTGGSIEIEIYYSIKLPDSKFTGYGYDDDNFYLKNWLIVFSNISNSIWYNQSNLNLDDQSLQKAGYKLKISFDEDLHLFSNLIKNNTEVSNNIKTVFLSGTEIKDVRINLLTQDDYKKFENFNYEIETDVFRTSSPLDSEIKVNRIVNFITNYFNDTNNNKLLVPRTDYESNPFYGFNELPSFISPFSDEFLEEIIFLKSFVINYLNQKLNLNKRESHWVYNGLEIFLLNKYINDFYPKVKFLGKLAGISLLKNYEISKINFNDLFLNYSEYVQRLNLHQIDDQSSEYLTRINQEIASPYHSGLGLIYLEEIIGENNFKDLARSINNSKTRGELNSLFLNYSGIDLDWFVEDYIGKRQSIDLKIKKINKNEIQVYEKNNINIPYSLGFLKNDSIIEKRFFEEYKRIELPKLDYDYVAINPDITIPESNRSNNWIYTKSNSNLKPLKVKFISDLENPKFKTLYLRPEITYNLYDGVSPGINILNKGLKNKPFSYEVFTQYASKEKTLVGSLNFRYQLNNEVKNNYSTVFNLFYNTNHYKENLRYQVFSPSVRINFRDNSNLRSKIRKSLTLSMFNVNKENNIRNDNLLDEYSIYNLGYYYSDIGIIKYLRTSINTEFSNNFGKLNLEFDYRKLLKGNRQFQARVFLGKFFWNNDQFDNFNYNLGRSGGYLFLDNYLGRSESSGLLSQQFIMAGGGFKSFFGEPTTNNFMLTTNLNIGIWKWIEGYLDLGMLKDDIGESRYFYGSGIRLNLLPDFFELYFPVSSSNGFELDDYRYYNNIRFIVSYNLESLGKLFSRRWL
ncbi:hypothetical protein OAJ01_02570 [Flavobacteriaceae bacterium]|nr:hypothetical protein [Flavobacteriaceae bacterium]